MSKVMGGDASNILETCQSVQAHIVDFIHECLHNKMGEVYVSVVLLEVPQTNLGHNRAANNTYRPCNPEQARTIRCSEGSAHRWNLGGPNVKSTDD